LDPAVVALVTKLLAKFLGHLGRLGCLGRRFSYLTAVPPNCGISGGFAEGPAWWSETEVRESEQETSRNKASQQETSRNKAQNSA